MRLSTGSTLGPYEIIGPIGAGGMGEVYRARDTRLGRDVAIKVLPHEMTANADRLARFEREARCASALNHPAIVTIHDFASRADETYLVMELVRGESLRDILRRGPLPLRKLLAIASGVADGLAAAHAAGIVHRDLKPENVMVASDGTPKILDFGLVKGAPLPDLTQSPTEVQLSAAGAIFGTASYMSPEQARGETVDFRSDQFSLGLMLSEMATGRHPFHRATPLETLAAILNDEPDRLSGSLPEPFAWIVERCLSKNASERYGSTDDLARDLVRLRDRSQTGALAPTAERQKPVVAGYWWIIAATGLVLATLGWIAVAIATNGRTRPFTDDPIQVSVATPEIASVHIGAVALPVVISPDGRYLAIYGTDVDGTHDLWVHDLRSGSTRRLAQNTFAAAWSSQSNAIAYFAEGKLKTIPVGGGPPQTVCDARPEGTPTWHGDTILFTQYSRDPGLYRVSAGGGKSQRIVEPTAKMHLPWWPQFLPDGKHFLYLTLIQPVDQGEVTHELLAGSLDGSAPRPVATIDSRAVFVDGHLLFVRDGTLLAQPFDPDRLRFTGEARPLLDDLYYFRNTGGAAFSASENGLLAWRSASPRTRLTWFDRAGLEVGVVGNAAVHTGGRLSPDGKRYVTAIIDPKQGVGDIWTNDLERGSQERLTFQLLDEQSPVWAPDGAIYFRSDGGGGPPDIFKLSPGQARKEIVYRGRGVNEPHDVSPDGRWLLFIDYTPPVGADISVLPLASPGAARAFVATPFQELSPRFSPDGQSVAYSSDASGRQEVYVRPFEGSGAPLRISQAGGTLPRWRQDGKELFFLAPGGRLMVAQLGPGGFGVPRMLFQSAAVSDYEVAADGSRFLMPVPENSGESPLHLLLNWRARLRSER